MIRKMKTLERRDKMKKHRPTTGELQEVIKQDKDIKSQDYENHRRRTISIDKTNGTFGFELQTYAIHHKGRRELELCTYVCGTAPDGPAHLAGMLPGDILLSVNGLSVENASHETIIHLIKLSTNALRLVVLFEDCIRRVELNKRSIQLKRKLFDKKLAYRALHAQEKMLLSGVGRSMYEMTMDCAESLDSEDSGFLSTPDLSSVSPLVSNKSHSMNSVTSIASTGFSISQIPGHQSLEEIGANHI